MSWQSDDALVDNHVDLAAQILGTCGLPVRRATKEEDQKLVCDLMWGAEPVAVRTRSSHYFHRFPNDITFRSRRDTGSETEVSKVMRGLGCWWFYGFAADEGVDFLKYTCLHLDTSGLRQTLPSFREFDNRDGTTLRVVDVRQVQPGSWVSFP